MKNIIAIEETPVKIIVGYTHDYYPYHTHCVPEGYTDVKPVYLHQQGSRTALCYRCGNGLTYDYSSALQASRSFLVKSLDDCNVINLPEKEYREAMHTFLVRLLVLAYHKTASEKFLLFVENRQAEVENLMYADVTEEIACTACMKSIIYNEIVRLYSLPYRA